MAKDLTRWLGYHFSSGSETGNDYLQFQKEMKADLQKKAQKAGCVLHHFLGNHYEFSAVLQDNRTGRFAYVSVPDVRFWQDEWYSHTLYRTMSNEQDWRGGCNNYCPWNDLLERIRVLFDREM